MNSQSVILMVFCGLSNDEIILVKNKEAHRKSETGEFLKRRGWGGPGGTVNEGETIFEAGLRELLEETNLKEKDVVVFPEVVAYLRKGGGHIKNLLVARVINTHASIDRETEEVEKVRRFSPTALPGGKCGIYEDHLQLFQWARKELMAMGENMPIIAIDEKASGRVHDKNRVERSFEKRRNMKMGQDGKFGRPSRRFQKSRRDEGGPEDNPEEGKVNCPTYLTFNYNPPPDVPADYNPGS